MDHTKLSEYFNDNCTKWIFQKEKGTETGYEHFQCRITLKHKMRLINVREKMVEKLGITGFHLTPTSRNCIRNNEEYYVTKEETRIDGPWKNGDLSVPSFFRNPTLRPWQQQIVNEIEAYTPEQRTINAIVNTTGNQGKTFLANYLGANDRIYNIPPLPDYKDIMQFMRSIYKDPKPVFIDIPRGLSSKTQESFYSAIETIKGGYLYDTRYKANIKYINPPCVYIFCNYFPRRGNLSWDRWNVRILKDGVLTPTRLF